MNPLILIPIIVCLLALVAGLVVSQRRKAEAPGKDQPVHPENGTINRGNDTSLAHVESYTLIPQFEPLAVLDGKAEDSLVEIKNQDLVLRISNVIPGTAQAIANTAAVAAFDKAAKATGPLYQVIIPEGKELVASRDLKGAFRGFFRNSKGIEGQANLVQVDGTPAQRLAAMNAVNSVMSIAAMVVGQYYMSHIQDQLEGIHSQLDQISGFQDREFQSKLMALTAETQKCSVFQTEIIENEELRKRELDHLQGLEHECAQLAGQANLTLLDFEKRPCAEFSDYEKRVAEAQAWFQYRQTAMRILQKIEELAYVLNLGRASRENCFALLQTYEKQTLAADESLKRWHQTQADRFKIDTDASRRRRKGIEGAIMSIPALFNDNLHYRKIDTGTVSMISTQRGDYQLADLIGSKDLFNGNVRLIAKDGKLYYLPEASFEI